MYFDVGYSILDLMYAWHLYTPKYRIILGKHKKTNRENEWAMSKFIQYINVNLREVSSSSAKHDWREKKKRLSRRSVHRPRQGILSIRQNYPNVQIRTHHNRKTQTYNLVSQHPQIQMVKSYEKIYSSSH